MAILEVKQTNQLKIPLEISKFFTNELTNYLVIKDGHIIIDKIDKCFEKLVITSEVNKLKIVVPKNFYEKQTFHLFNLYGSNSTSSEIEIVLNQNAELSYFEYLYNF